MNYAFVHNVCDRNGLVVDLSRLTVFIVSRRARYVGPWRRIGAWVPIGENGWAYIGHRRQR
jgi:hypothetical protein